jgi:hypothetical protein
MNSLWSIFLLSFFTNALRVVYSGKPNDDSLENMQANSDKLTAELSGLKPGDELYIPNQVFPVFGGISVKNLAGVKITIDGTLLFAAKRKEWPTGANGKVLDSITFVNLKDSIITSGGLGVIDGDGEKWWGFINYLRFKSDRPKLFRIIGSKNVIVERLFLKDPPYWSFWATESNGLIVRFMKVRAKRTNKPGHSIWDLSAFNTDGIDVTGRNVHIHDCDIDCQDDCVAVKDNSQNMLIERITCSGLGLVVGSIGDSKVNNITFRDSVLPNTFKGMFHHNDWNLFENKMERRRSQCQCRNFKHSLQEYNNHQARTVCHLDWTCSAIWSKM